jgi:hypothetical protein
LEVSLLKNKAKVATYECPTKLELDVVVQLNIMVCDLLLMAMLLYIFFPFWWDGVVAEVPVVDAKG